MSDMQYWEVTTRLGATVERCDTGGPIIDNKIVIFKVQDDVEAFYVIDNIIGAGLITEIEYNEFRSASAKGVDNDSDESLDSATDDSYRGHLESQAQGMF